MNPYDSDTLALYGLCAMQLNDLPAAEEAFLKSMEYLDIENFRHNPYLYILMVYFRQKRYDMVVEAGLTLIEKFGAGTWILIKLIEAYYGLGQMEEVQKCFKKLFELQENHAGGHYTYAVFLHHTKGPRAAQEYFAKILRKYPKDPMIVKNAGLYYYMFLMDFENASGFYEKAFEMTTQDLDFDYINLYESLWYAVRTKKGTLSDSFEIYSSRVNTMRQFEMEQYFSTMTGQVERYFEQYGEYEREDYHYFDLVAEAYFYNGNLDSAEKYARMALNTPMEESDTVRISFDALFVMGLVHESRGELEQAREYYKRLREETEGSFYDYPIHREALERICRKLSGALPVKEGFRLKSLFSRKS